MIIIYNVSLLVCLDSSNWSDFFFFSRAQLVWIPVSFAPWQRYFIRPYKIIVVSLVPRKKKKKKFHAPTKWHSTNIFRISLQHAPYHFLSSLSKFKFPERSPRSAVGLFISRLTHAMFLQSEPVRTAVGMLCLRDAVFELRHCCALPTTDELELSPCVWGWQAAIGRGIGIGIGGVWIMHATWRALVWLDRSKAIFC